MIACQTSSVDSTREQGLYVASVAYNNGFQVGDRIIAIDGTEIATCAQMRETMRGYKAGDSVDVTVLREGEPVEIEVVLTEADVPDTAAGPAA